MCERQVAAIGKTLGTAEEGVAPISHFPNKELKAQAEKLKEVARKQHEHIVMLTTRITRLQAAFCKQETQAILLETAYRMGLKTKEVKNLIFTKYLETLRSKVEDVTRIMELEGLLKSKGIEIPKKNDDMFTGSFTEILHVQLEKLSSILSVNDGDGSTSDISLIDQEHKELLAHVPLSSDVDLMLGKETSGV
ncbi:hypothetical protein R1sor_020062 [Riccia sorocarpa]|uniref:Uncharacterized protein n=1 Tax=Riccia sorocarpa TaxID=122646 RepID=A0ABD3IHY9_9MARC